MNYQYEEKTPPSDWIARLQRVTNLPPLLNIGGSLVLEVHLTIPKDVPNYSDQNDFFWWPHVTIETLNGTKYRWYLHYRFAKRDYRTIELLNNQSRRRNDGVENNESDLVSKIAKDAREQNWI